jgi:hypothetical protein
MVNFALSRLQDELESLPTRLGNLQQYGFQKPWRNLKAMGLAKV